MSKHHNHFNKEHGIAVFHASPQLNLREIHPRFSPKFQDFGVFVTHSKESIWNSWGWWAARKPASSHSARRAENPCLHFDKVAVYTFYLPRDLYRECEKRHWARAKECGSPFGAWGWDIETFIPSSLVPILIPSSRKVFTYNELQRREKESRGYHGKAHEDTTLVVARSLWNNDAAALYVVIHEWLLSFALANRGEVEHFRTTVDEIKALKKSLVPLFYNVTFNPRKTTYDEETFRWVSRDSLSLVGETRERFETLRLWIEKAASSSFNPR